MTTISNLSPLLTPTPTSTASSSATSTQAAGATDPVTLALQKAQQRLQAQVDATTASLSAYGKLQSTVSDTQLAASALGGLSDGSSTAEVQLAAAKFISTFNTAASTASGMASTAGPSSTESRNAARVGRDLDRAITDSTATAQALSAVGITREADGTLTVDATKFAAAQKADPAKVLSALGTIGQAVDNATSDELASGGAVGDSMAALAQRSTTLTAQQNALLAAAKEFATNQATQQEPATANGAAGIAGLAGSGYGASYGLAAYISNS